MARPAVRAEPHRPWIVWRSVAVVSGRVNSRSPLRGRRTVGSSFHVVLLCLAGRTPEDLAASREGTKPRERIQRVQGPAMQTRLTGVGADFCRSDRCVLQDVARRFRSPRDFYAEGVLLQSPGSRTELAHPGLSRNTTTNPNGVRQAGTGSCSGRELSNPVGVPGISSTGTQGALARPRDPGLRSATPSA